MSAGTRSARTGASANQARSAGLDARVLARLRKIVGDAFVRVGTAATLPYATDGNPAFWGAPDAVVAPADPEQTRGVLAALAEAGVPFVPRGSGTGLSGGAIAASGGVVVDLARLRGPIVGHPDDRTARVPCGVTNLSLSAWAADFGLFYAPDPSSQVACSLGGNVAENAGGSHCLKYGVTTNHVRGLRLVRSDGSEVWLGGEAVEWPGYDLVGVFVGSEGTFGVATEATVSFTRRPAAVRTVLAEFADEDAAAGAVVDIMAGGVVPAALEMMDRLAIDGVERGPYRVGYPDTTRAVLLAEVDGPPEAVEEEGELLQAWCVRRGALRVRVATTEDERQLWWQNRKTAFGAMGNLAKNYYVQDGVIPRTRVATVLPRVRAAAAEVGLRVANVFHAGDGNLHPLLLFDGTQPGERERALAAGSEILRICVEMGGSITGEHGVGVEKRAEMAWMFTAEERAVMAAVRAAFDPSGLANPGKVLPP